MATPIARHARRLARWCGLALLFLGVVVLYWLPCVAIGVVISLVLERPLTRFEQLATMGAYILVTSRMYPLVKRRVRRAFS